MEKAITFRSGPNQLCGVVHLPEDGHGGRARVGFVFPHSGSRGRLGNTFHYPLFARELCQLGFPGLRFDPHGIGDSTGEHETCNMNDFYGSIQVGRFVGDTLAAVEELCRQTEVERVVLFGICGGAITALLAAPLSKQISGLVLLSVPVLLDSSNQDELDRMPREYARRYLLSIYGRKLFSLAAWKRLFTLQSEIGTIGKLLHASLTSPSSRGAARAKRSPGAKIAFNDHFVKALDAAIAQGNRVLFLFGEEDAFRWEFEREFYNVRWDTSPLYPRHCNVHFLKSCNHMFTLKEWQLQAVKLTTDWLGKPLS